MFNYKKTFDSWLPALFDGEFHWDFLLPAWMPTRIEPMDTDAQMTVLPDASSAELRDIDAKIERRGHRLLFETKKKGVGIPNGQRWTLENEWRIGATIIHVEGKQPAEITGCAVYRESEFHEGARFGSKSIDKCDAFDLLYVCRKWFQWANGRKTPSREEWDVQLWQWDYARQGDGKKWDVWCRQNIAKPR